MAVTDTPAQSRHAIPQHTQHLVERLLAEYCRSVCPPTARHAVKLGFRLEADRVTLHEIRSFCGVPGAHRYVDVAQFRYSARGAGGWRLFHAADGGCWKRYTPRPASRSFLELLRELDADPAGRFWTQVNGKSLRWCSSDGRCPGCDEEYCAILGRSRSQPGVVISVDVPLRRRHGS
jgi:hypothetical protein